MNDSIARALRFFFGHRPDTPAEKMSDEDVKVYFLLHAAYPPIGLMLLLPVLMALSPYLMEWTFGGEAGFREAFSAVPGGEWLAEHFHYLAWGMACLGWLVVLPFLLRRYRVRRYLASRGIRL